MNLLSSIKKYLQHLRTKSYTIEEFRQKVSSKTAGNEKIFELLSADKPCMISRFGSTELSLIYYYYLRFGNWRIITWPSSCKTDINKLSGFFPSTDVMLSKFCKEFIEHLRNADVMGVWFKPGEHIMINRFASKAFLTPLDALEPYYFDNPWSRVLKDKKVLVIHPFANTIETQYLKCQSKLFKENVLPEFKLEVIQAVQSLGTTQTKYETWFDAYDFMCRQIKKKDFDIAIIGAGAYGLPLASFVKGLGKKSVHLGGATQLLFGIKGRRWDNDPLISLLINEHWTRPSEIETPAIENLPEDGCYW